MVSFKSFLIKAKRNTYASNGEGGENRLPDGARELSYSASNFFYVEVLYKQLCV